MRKRIRHDGRVPITFSLTVDCQSLIKMGGQGTLIKVLKSFSRQREKLTKLYFSKERTVEEIRYKHCMITRSQHGILKYKVRVKKTTSRPTHPCES